jgi:hypothetical protein
MYNKKNNSATTATSDFKTWLRSFFTMKSNGALENQERFPEEHF